MKLINWLGAIAGAALLAGMIFWIGPRVLAAQLTALGVAVPLLLALGLIKHVLRSWAWHSALRAEGVRLPFGALLRVRIEAQSVAYLSAMGGVAGDPLKVWLLRDQVEMKRTLEPTLAEAATYWFTSLLVGIAGVLAGIVLVFGQGVSGPLTAAWLAAFGGAALLLLTSSPALPRVADLAERRARPGSKWPSRLRKAGEIEARVRTFRLRHPRDAVFMLSLDFLVQIVMLAEVWAVLRALGVSAGLPALLAIEGASRLVKIAGAYVPGRLGAEEAGAAGSFAALGLDPAAGFALAIARRIQGIAWTAVGLAGLALAHTRTNSPRSPESEANRPPLSGALPAANQMQGAV